MASAFKNSSWQTEGSIEDSGASIVNRIQFSRLLSLIALSVCANFAALTPAGSHEIPNDITIHTLIKPEEDRLLVLVRVPLEAMRDMNFPLIGPGYLDLPRADSQLRDAATQWIANDLSIYEDQEPLPGLRVVAVRASIPSDRSFQSYDSALAHVLGPPLAPGTGLVWQQALMDVLLDVPIQSDQSNFSISSGFNRLGLGVSHLIRYLAPDGSVRSYATGGDAELLPLDPNSYQAASRFFRQGFLHIPDGTDHILFLLCLVLPLRHRLGSLVGVVTAFTVAHSITLAVSALGGAPTFLSFPPLVEMLIAISILYLAVENAIGAQLRTSWLIAFGFGLVHGFGFSFALQNTLQFAGDHLAMSLLSFNLGVEFGQLMILAVLVPALHILFRYGVKERIGTILISVIVAHTAWHWMLDRHAAWQAYNARWTDLSQAMLTGELRWLLVLIAGTTAALCLRSKISPVFGWISHRSRAER